MPKFTSAERILLKFIVATLSIKRIRESEIIKEIFHQTNKSITARYLSYLKQQIKKESYLWYKTMREGEYEYIHEFKERIDEILWLQRKHHEIIDSTKSNTEKQTSLAELHRLNITLANYFDVAPYILGNNKQNDNTISDTPETKRETAAGTMEKYLLYPSQPSSAHVWRVIYV